MNTTQVETSKVIHANPAQIYNVIRDYEIGHQAILPRQYFKEMRVVKGGQGAGTEIHIIMEVWGQTHESYFFVSEPEPGRVILEKDEKSVETQFIIDPLAGDEHAQVTISSTFILPTGITGYVQKFLLPIMMRRIYNEELDILANYIQQKTPIAT